MTGLLSRLYEDARRNYRDRGIRGLGTTVGRAAGFVRRRVAAARARRRGQNVYDRRWDVLVLLDCARVDMMEEVRDEYDFIGEVGTHTTLETASEEWMEQTFTDAYAAEMRETLHVTANTSSDAVLDADDFLHLEEVWRNGWDREHGTILAETVTDRAVALHRQLSPDRTIVHYMQPHPPFVQSPEVAATAVTGGGIDADRGKNVQELAESGYGREELWDLHVENLRYALDNLEVLLSNIDAERVVVSADHGQALGEEGVWGHPAGSTLDCLREVPWCVTTASDSGAYEPDYEPGSRSTGEPELSVEEKLRHLGYRSD